MLEMVERYLELTQKAVKDLYRMVEAATLYKEEDSKEFVRAVDWVSDWSKEAGRILAIIPFYKAPDEMKVAAQNMCKANVDCEIWPIETI